MPCVTARPHARWIERAVPFVCWLSTTSATAPVPKAIRTKVPRNSAAASRRVPRSTAGYTEVGKAGDLWATIKVPRLGDRPTVGYMALDHGTGVRIPVSQPSHPQIGPVPTVERFLLAEPYGCLPGRCVRRLGRPAQLAERDTSDTITGCSGGGRGTRVERGGGGRKSAGWGPRA